MCIKVFLGKSKYLSHVIKDIHGISRKINISFFLEFRHKVFATTQVPLDSMEFLNVDVSEKCRNLFEMDVTEVLCCSKLAMTSLILARLTRSALKMLWRIGAVQSPGFASRTGGQGSIPGESPPLE